MSPLANILGILTGCGWAGPAVLTLCLCQTLELTGAELPQVAQEYDLKAAFLFNLTKFVRWPPAKLNQPDSPLIIGIRGEDALERFARVLQGKTIDKHKLTIQRLERVEDVRSCQVVFISRSEKERLADWTEAGKSAAVLTVGEAQQFLEQGGMIRFSIESEQLRLEINEQCAHQAGVNIMANALSTLVNKGIAKIRNF
jgi:hypothetical protein